MNKSNYSVALCMRGYCSPKCEILEIKAEGILCHSADFITQRNPIDFDDDYQQIL